MASSRASRAKLVTRNLYKRERAPDRKAGVLGKDAPAACRDATSFEILAALVVVAGQCGIKIGQGGEYDRVTDTYTVVAKSLRTGVAQDFKISGIDVAEAIWGLRFFLRDVGDPRRDLIERGLLGAPPAPATGVA